MNKLSELSKPVAWEVKGILCHSEEEARIYVGEPEPLYSQEYASALLAELESKSAYAADWCHSAKKRKDLLDDANKRIAELSRLLAHNIERAEKAEKRLATPVRLPNKNDDEFWFDGVFQVAKFDRAVERAISAAGFKFLGDE